MDCYNFRERKPLVKLDNSYTGEKQQKKKKGKHSRNGLFGIEVTARNHETSQVRIHYIGYDGNYDEWRKEEEIEILHCG